MYLPHAQYINLNYADVEHSKNGVDTLTLSAKGEVASQMLFMLSGIYAKHKGACVFMPFGKNDSTLHVFGPAANDLLGHFKDDAPSTFIKSLEETMQAGSPFGSDTRFYWTVREVLGEDPRDILSETDITQLELDASQDSPDAKYRRDWGGPDSLF